MILLIVFALIIPPAPIQRQIRLILIEPPFETVDDAAIQTAQQAVTGAAAFWHNRAPFAVDLQLASTEVITTEVDVYSDTTWSIGLASTDLSRITIVIIDNRNSGKLLLVRHGGWAQPWNNLMVVLLRTGVGPNALAARIAHELGHVLFDLPDLYAIPGACDRIDIMCYHVAAYNTPTIGCASLALLGYPCHRINIPLAMR